MKLGMLDFTKFGNLLGIKPFTKKKTFYYQIWELGIFSCECEHHCLLLAFTCFETKWLFLTLLACLQVCQCFHSRNLFLVCLCVQVEPEVVVSITLGCHICHGCKQGTMPVMSLACFCFGMRWHETLGAIFRPN